MEDEEEKKSFMVAITTVESPRRRLFGATTILIMLVEDDAQKIELEIMFWKITSSQRWVCNFDFLILQASFLQKPREIYV